MLYYIETFRYTLYFCGMEIIIAIILAILLIVGMVILYRVNIKNKTKAESQNEIKEVDLSCCGAHDDCEFDNALVNPDLIEYFDDEDLDQYKNIEANDFTDDMIDEFREVLYTLKTDEIKHWLLSISRRKINLPSILNEEAIMLMAEE